MTQRVYKLGAALLLSMAMLFSVLVVPMWAEEEPELMRPVISGLRVANGPVAAPGALTLAFDIEAEAGGEVRGLRVVYGHSGGGTYALQDGFDAKGSGSHEMTYQIYDWPAGEYQLLELDMMDMQNRSIEYRPNGEGVLADVVSGTALTGERGLTITSSQLDDDTAPLVTGLRLTSAVTESYGSVAAEVGIFEQESGLGQLYLQIADGAGSGATLWMHAGGPMGNALDGTYPMEGDLYQELPDGAYQITEIGISDGAGNWNTYTWQAGSGSFVSGVGSFSYDGTPVTIANSTVPNDQPQVKGLTVVKGQSGIPGAAEYEIELVEEVGGAVWITLQYRLYDEDGGFETYTLGYAPEQPLFTGKHQFTVGIDEDMPEGTYLLQEIGVQDALHGYAEYFYNSDNGQFVGFGAPGSFTAERELVLTKGALTLNTENGPGLAAAIAALAEGGTAYVDYSANSVVDKAVFEALAGTNKTAVFGDGTLRWVFRGADIEPDGCKTIDLAAKVRYMIGERYNAKRPVLVIDFANNGALPCEASITVYHDGVVGLALDAAENGVLYITQYDEAAKKPLGSSWNALFTDDGGVTFNIFHNSQYVISVEKLLAAVEGGGEGSGSGSGGASAPDEGRGTGSGSEAGSGGSSSDGGTGGSSSDGGNASNGDGNNDKTNPKTGDGGMAVYPLMGVLGMLAAAGGVTIRFRIKRG